MSLDVIRIATRKSPLAMKQTQLVKAQLLKLNPKMDVQLIPFQTQGDKFLNQSLSKIGGKGLFVKELEVALLNNEADIAVHSMKDVPYELPKGLEIKAILKRENPYDALISHAGYTFNELPLNARIGTSSMRRACQLQAIRKDLKIVPLRGNINTRLKKCQEFDAIILATAGLSRMGFESQITQYLTSDQLLPAAGQGALGLECRSNDVELINLIEKLACQETTKCVLAERAVIKTLQGSCQVPLAAFATLNQNHLELKALVGRHDGTDIITANNVMALDESPDHLGQTLAQQLIDKGAQSILNDYL